MKPKINQPSILQPSGSQESELKERSHVLQDSIEIDSEAQKIERKQKALTVE